MIPTEVLSVRLGRSAAEVLTRQQAEFYIALAGQCLGKSCEPAWQGNKSTIPIESATLNGAPSEIYSRILKASDDLNPNAQVLVIDVSNPRDAVLRGGYEIHLGQAIGVLTGQALAGRTIILLLPEIPPEGDSLRKLLVPLCNSRRLLVIAEGGKCIGEFSLAANIREGIFEALVARIRARPLDLLRRKMVRKLGHFRIGTPSKGYCLRHYFDGTHCGSEITALIREYLEREPGLAGSQLVYNCEATEWFAFPVLDAAEQLGSAAHAASTVLNGAVELDATKPVLVVSFLVDTGSTLLDIMTKLSGRVPDVILAAFSVLSTRGDDESHGKQQLRRSHDEITYKYAWRVSRHRYGERCPLCELHIPFLQNAQEPKMLTSYDFWDMVLEQGGHPERDVPGYRPGFEWVPNFSEMIKKNGAWLASKISGLIALASDDANSDTVIVYPDEAGARALAEYLDLVTGATVIGIPKAGVLNALHGDVDLEAQLRAWEDEKPAWMIALRTSTASEVIVLDEFSVSYGTYLAMEKLLEMFNLGVRCFIPMVDFNPDFSMQKRVDRYTLYEWQHERLYGLCNE